MDMTTLDLARQAVADDPRPLTVKAAEIGVSASWLRMYLRGNIPDPSYARAIRVIAWAKYRRRRKHNS